MFCGQMVNGEGPVVWRQHTEAWCLSCWAELWLVVIFPSLIILYLFIFEELYQSVRRQTDTSHRTRHIWCMDWKANARHAAVQHNKTWQKQQVNKKIRYKTTQITVCLMVCVIDQQIYVNFLLHLDSKVQVITSVWEFRWCFEHTVVLLLI